MSGYQGIQPHQLQSKELALGLAVWLVSITAGVGIFFEMQMFSALIGQTPIGALSASIFGAVVGVIVGSGVVLVQRLAPLHPVVMTEAWVLGTMGGWALAGALFELLLRITSPLVLALMNETLSYSIMGAGAGLGFGLSQWLAVRRYVAKLHLLLLANVVGWSVGITIARFIYQFNWGPADGFFLSITLAGSVPSLITGLILSKLPTQSANEIVSS